MALPPIPAKTPAKPAGKAMGPATMGAAFNQAKAMQNTPVKVMGNGAVMCPHCSKTFPVQTPEPAGDVGVGDMGAGAGGPPMPGGMA